MLWAERPTGADRLLGEGHPLAAVEGSIATLRDQMVVCAAFVAGSPVFLIADRTSAAALLVSAVIVEMALCAGIAIMRSVRRDRIHDMIVAGEIPELEVVAGEVRRLRSSENRERLAASLERAVHDGEHWHEFMPAARPPQGVRSLPAHGKTIHEIAAGLRADRASIRGVVLVERLLRGGFGSALYDGNRRSLDAELRRIRFELSAQDTPADSSRVAA